MLQLSVYKDKLQYGTWYNLLQLIFFKHLSLKWLKKLSFFFSIKNLYFSNFQHKNHKHFYEKKILLIKASEAIPLFTVFFLPKTEENTEAYLISGSLAVFYKSKGDNLFY